jgi:phospholipid-transporting ATPase
LLYIAVSLIVYNSEVNLKIKQALPETASYLSPSDVSNLAGILKCEQPNNRLYNYDGTLGLNLDGKTKDFPLDPSKLLLRGAQLRNTSWIYGIVVFTGHETKLMLNSRYIYIYLFI